jgi:cation diffusion facilitator CzcD-associated flavoprotein CzcO
MPKLHYRIVPHDGGWAYRSDDGFSEPFRDKATALAAARRVAQEQRVPGETTRIEYQDAGGKWHVELSEGGDRPETDVLP